MIQIRELSVGGKRLPAFKVDLPGAPLLAVIAPKGYIMCGYLNRETAEKLGQAAAIVTGVKDFNDIMDRKISSVTSHARKLGVREGMTGKEALRKMT